MDDLESDRHRSVSVSGTPLSGWGELAFAGATLGFAVWVVTGLFVWPQLLFATCSRTTAVIRLPDQPMVRDQRGYAINHRFGFRDNYGEIHLLYDEWVWNSNHRTRQASGNPAYLGAREVQYIPWYPAIRRPSPSGSHDYRNHRQPNPLATLDTLLAIHLLSLSYVIAFFAMRRLRRKRSVPLAERLP